MHSNTLLINKHSKSGSKKKFTPSQTENCPFSLTTLTYFSLTQSSSTSVRQMTALKQNQHHSSVSRSLSLCRMFQTNRSFCLNTVTLNEPNCWSISLSLANTSPNPIYTNGQSLIPRPYLLLSTWSKLHSHNHNTPDHSLTSQPFLFSHSLALTSHSDISHPVLSILPKYLNSVSLVLLLNLAHLTNVHDKLYFYTWPSLHNTTSTPLCLTLPTHHTIACSNLATITHHPPSSHTSYILTPGPSSTPKGLPKFSFCRFLRSYSFLFFFIPFFFAHLLNCIFPLLTSGCPHLGEENIAV